MKNEQWIQGSEAVFLAVSEWGKEVLGTGYVLLRNGPYGPHCLLGSTSKPQWLHLDSAYPFFSGLDLTLDSHTIACLL